VNLQLRAAMMGFHTRLNLQVILERDVDVERLLIRTAINVDSNYWKIDIYCWLGMDGAFGDRFIGSLFSTRS
jgi:hypothetical protein